MTKKVNNIMSWNKGNLGALCSLQAGGTPCRSNLSYWKNGKIKWISAKHITDDKIQGWEYISEDGLKNSSSKLSNPGDLILVTRVSVGKLLFCDDSYAVNQDLTIIRASSKVNNKFLFYNLKSLLGKIISSSQGLAIKGIERKTLEKLPISYPNIKEQQKIVEVLETWDKAIGLTKQLIEQKELQKKYLMQQLLTGRTRLKGFTDKWENVRLKQLCSIQKGQQLNANTLTKNGKYACLNGGIIPSGYTTKWNTEANTISISEGGNSCGYVNWNDSRFWAGGHCYTLANVKISNSFLYFVLKNKEGHIMNLRVGSGLPNIQRPSLEKLLLKIPSAQKEQQDIAQVLSSCDKEIDLLKQKLAKLEEQKKGLMQVLLTGKVRL